MLFVPVLPKKDKFLRKLPYESELSFQRLRSDVLTRRTIQRQDKGLRKDYIGLFSGQTMNRENRSLPKTTFGEEKKSDVAIPLRGKHVRWRKTGNEERGASETHGSVECLMTRALYDVRAKRACARKGNGAYFGSQKGETARV